MNRLVKRIKSVLSESAGETLIEGLASIMVFVVLVAAVTMMIMVSMRITAVSTANAQTRQTEAAAVLAGDITFAGLISDDDEVTFRIPNTPVSLTVTIPVTVFSTNAFVAFEP